MSLSKAKYLLDVNVFVALLTENYIHHQIATAWFNASRLQWAICPFTEAGFLRNATASRPGQITMNEATAVMATMVQHPGYHYLPISAGWHTLCSPFFEAVVWHQASDRCLSAWLGPAREAGPGHVRQGHRPSGRRTPQPCTPVELAPRWDPRHS